ncbi:MAG: SWIB/MDM2 domain-containing protein [Hansschlegelia sp.]
MANAAKPANAPKSAAPKSAKPKSAKTGGAHAQVKPSAELAAVVGKDPLPRTEVVSKMWDYIKKNKLQNPDDGREIIADETLGKLFGKKKITMFELNKIISAHVS